MGIPILVKRHLYTEKAPRLFLSWGVINTLRPRQNGRHIQSIKYQWNLYGLIKTEVLQWFFYTNLWALVLTQWGRVKQICVSEIIIIGSDNGLLPGQRQAIIWTNAGILLIGPLGINFSEILIEINTFSFNKMHLKISSAKWRLFLLGLNVLRKLKERSQWNS